MNTRVLHLPCNTPYVKKIHNELSGLRISNGTVLSGGEIIPDDISFEWVLKKADDESFWSSFDIVHIHYGFELEQFCYVSETLGMFSKKNKPIVYTYHEECSVHGVVQSEYENLVRLIVGTSQKVITLSEAAVKSFHQITGKTAVELIPHGEVVPSDSDLFGYSRTKNIKPNILLFGSLRPNRDLATSMINLSLGVGLPCTVTLLTRPVNARQLTESASLRTAISMSAHPDVSLQFVLPLSDSELVKRVVAADILVLPYSFAGHSGQLELAFDCGVIPVITNVGFMQSQILNWPKNFAEQVQVVDWSDGKHWTYPTRLVEKVRDAIRLIPAIQPTIDMEGRKLFRRNEHQTFLQKHLEVYMQTK